MARCAAIKANGERCKVVAIPDAEWCWSHHPDYEQARQRRASKGGRRGGRGRPSPATAELARLQARFEELAERVLDDDKDKRLDRAVASVAGQLLNGARSCLRDALAAKEQEELVARLEALEEGLERNNGGGRGWGA